MPSELPSGLTTREIFALILFVDVISKTTEGDSYGKAYCSKLSYYADLNAQTAVVHADALIKALEKARE